MLATIVFGLFFSQQVFADGDFNFLEVTQRNCRRGVIERSQAINDKSVILQGDYAKT